MTDIDEWCKLHEEILKDIRTEAYRSGYHDGEIAVVAGLPDIDWICVKFFEWISTKTNSPSVYACEKEWEELRKISFAKDRDNILNRIAKQRRQHLEGCDRYCMECQDNNTCPESMK
jgi:hypothetical protein